MKLFGINLGSGDQIHHDIEPKYTRFAPDKTRMSARTVDRNSLNVSFSNYPDQYIKSDLQTPAKPQADELLSEDNLNISTLRNALPKRFEALHEEIARDARDAARDLAAAAN